MSQKNETVVLTLAFLIIVALIGGGLWWFSNRIGVNLEQLTNSRRDSQAGRTHTNSPPLAETAQANAVNSFALVSNVPSGVFNYSGSTSWASIRLAVGAALQAARPEFCWRYMPQLMKPPVLLPVFGC